VGEINTKDYTKINKNLAFQAPILHTCKLLFYSEETEIRNCQGFFKRVVCANKMVE
jgi:hypothetical protein